MIRFLFRACCAIMWFCPKLLVLMVVLFLLPNPLSRDGQREWRYKWEKAKASPTLLHALYVLTCGGPSVDGTVEEPERRSYGSAPPPLPRFAPDDPDRLAKALQALSEAVNGSDVDVD